MSAPDRLTSAQVNTLLQPIVPSRVLTAQGNSHVPAYDVVAHLTRIFGFGGWEKEIIDLRIVHERSTPPVEKKGKPGEFDQGRWWVTYSCTMRLTIKAPDGTVLARYEDAATGSAQNMPSPADAYDFAIKNAVSYAIKRCAKDLGDQFGLSLYNKGMKTALLRKTLVMPAADDKAHEDVQEGVPEAKSMGNDEVDRADGEQEPPAAPGPGRIVTNGNRGAGRVVGSDENVGSGSRDHGEGEAPAVAGNALLDGSEAAPPTPPTPDDTAGNPTPPAAVGQASGSAPVSPPVAEAEPVPLPNKVTEPKFRQIHAAMKANGIGDDGRHAIIEFVTGSRTTSSRDVTMAEADTILNLLGQIKIRRLEVKEHDGKMAILVLDPKGQQFLESIERRILPASGKGGHPRAPVSGIAPVTDAEKEEAF